MLLNEFVMGLKKERDALFASYVGPDSLSDVAQQLQQAQLSDEQSGKVAAALDVALTDAFYTILLALDGAASLNGSQQSYRLENELGEVISTGDGSLEARAFEVFQTGA